MDYWIKIFDFVIKLFAVLAIIIVSVSIARVKRIEIKIEKLYSDLHSAKENLNLNRSGMFQTALAYEIEEEVNLYMNKIEFYERKRERILSKIPFLK